MINFQFLFFQQDFIFFSLLPFELFEPIEVDLLLPFFIESLSFSFSFSFSFSLSLLFLLKNPKLFFLGERSESDSPATRIPLCEDDFLNDESSECLYHIRIFFFLFFCFFVFLFVCL